MEHTFYIRGRGPVTVTLPDAPTKSGPQTAIAKLHLERIYNRDSIYIHTILIIERRLDTASIILDENQVSVFLHMQIPIRNQYGPE